ncbi:MAG: hypothetical protein U0531_16230 [Dehalococcoidia bacterium]
MAGIGLSLAIIGAELFAVVVMMSFATTLFAPPMLYAIFRRSPEAGQFRDQP